MMYDTHRFFATIPKNVISSIVLALERSERAYITKLFFYLVGFQLYNLKSSRRKACSVHFDKC